MKASVELLVFVFVLLTSSCFCQYKDEVEKIRYENDTLKRINYYSSDTIVRSTFFRKDGSIESDVYICKNIKFFKMYYENGSLSGEFTTIQGKKQGKGIVYYNDGKVLAIWNYRNGLEEGNQLFYNKDGSIEKIQVFEKGRFINEKLK